MSSPYTYIDSDRALAEHGRHWRECTQLAVDTEFIRESTFYPIAALFQVNDGQGVYLIDPLSIEDFSPLIDALTAPGVEKILHSCSEDLEVFDRFLNCCPAPVFDTQIAAVIAGYGSVQSYQKLVNHCLGVELEKGETRSDWLQRPLSDRQKIYAAHDVEYLLDVSRHIKADLQRLGREGWVEQECRGVIEAFTRPADPAQYYLKIKSAYKLSPAQLNVLQQLCVWREAEARRRDVPRSRILKDAQCMEIARRDLTRAEDLSRIKGISYKQIQRFGESIAEVIAQAGAMPAEQRPEALPAPLSREEKALLHELRDAVGSIAESLGLPTEVLMKKRDYEALIVSARDGGDHQMPPALHGWRMTLLGDALHDVLNRKSTDDQ